MIVANIRCSSRVAQGVYFRGDALLKPVPRFAAKNPGLDLQRMNFINGFERHSDPLDEC